MKLYISVKHIQVKDVNMQQKQKNKINIYVVMIVAIYYIKDSFVLILVMMDII